MFQTETPRYPSSFPFLFPGKKPPSSSKTLALRSRSFEEKLLRGLKSLLSALASDPGASCITFSWLSRAIGLLSSIHADAESFVSDLMLSASERSLEGYLDESVRILDVCNAVSAEIERLRHGRLLVSYALRLVDCSGGSHPAREKLLRAREALSDWKNLAPVNGRRFNLEDSSALIKDLSKKFEIAPRGKSPADKALERTVYAVGAVTVFVAGVVVAAFSGMADLAPIPLSGDFAWAGAFADLQSKVLGSIRRLCSGEKRWSTEEREAVSRSVEELAGVINDAEGADVQTERWSSAVKNLERAAAEFSGGLDGLADGVNGFFRAVLATRSTLLKNFGDSA